MEKNQEPSEGKLGSLRHLLGLCCLYGFVKLHVLGSALKDFVQFILDFTNAYTQKEVQIVIGAAFLVYAMWGYACISLSLPNPLKSIMMWGLIFTLTVLVAAIGYVEKQ